MREFKPMVKMETTEPTVELKLKKGGAVEKKMARGGAPMGAMVGAPKGRMMAGAKPKKPSLAARRRAMMASGAAGAPSGRAEAMMAAMPAMKKGGEMESSKVHKAEMKELSGIKKKLTKHEDMPASKGHRGLKTGGVVNGNGGFKAGGSVSGSCGYKTGGVAMANAGGFRKGGAAKKFAEGGRVQHDGGPEQMKQGKKKPAGPVSINQLSGTYKKGGAVMMAAGGSTQSANAAAQRADMRKNAAISAQVAAQKAIADRANARKPAAQKTAEMNAQKAAAEKAMAQKAAAAKPQIVVSKPTISVSKPSTVTPPPVRPEIQYTGPKTAGTIYTDGYDSGKDFGVRVSQTPVVTPMPKPVPMPVPAGKYDRPTVPSVEPSIQRPMPIPRVESTAYRRGGKVQNNRKNRGGAVC